MQPAAQTGYQMAPLDGKVCVVTGSTQGIGEAIARAFAASGASGLVITGRNEQRGEAVAVSIASSHPSCRVIFVQADLADADQTKAIIAAADKAFSRVDVLVNAAGTTERGTLLDTSVELYDRIMAVNTRAPFLLMQAAARIMRREKAAGAIVNIQSMSAHGGQPFICPYAISKGALATLTKNAAFGLMPDRIRVNGLNIGWSETPGEDSIMRRCHGAQDGWQQKAAASQPFGRLIQPSEVARCCVYLCSEESGLITGSNIDFDQSVLGCYDSPPHPAQRIADA